MQSLLEHCLGEKRTLCLPNDNLLKTTSKTKLRHIIHEEFLLNPDAQWQLVERMLYAVLPTAISILPIVGIGWDVVC